MKQKEGVQNPATQTPAEENIYDALSESERLSDDEMLEQILAEFSQEEESEDLRLPPRRTATVQGRTEASPTRNDPPKRRETSPSRSGKRRKRKGIRFGTGMLIYLCVLTVAIIGVLVYFWNYLAQFQSEWDLEAARQEAEEASRYISEVAIPRAPQLAFEDWQSQLTPDYWTDLWYSTAPDDLDGREKVYAAMEKLFDSNAVQAYKATEYTSETPVYVLKSGEETLARVTLTGSELTWNVSRVELLYKGPYSASVWAASGCTVLCNGRELDSQYCVESVSYFHYEQLKEQLNDPVLWNRYEVEGLLVEPEMVAGTPENCTIFITEDGESLLLLDGDTTAYTEKAVAFVRAYLYYYMSGKSNTQANYNKVMAFLTRGTQAYEDISKTIGGVSWNNPYNNIDTSKTTAGDVIVWADNCYSVDVTYDADCKSGNTPVDYADATMRIYFLKKDNDFYISNFEVL